jgi:hypothetical protein
MAKLTYRGQSYETPVQSAPIPTESIILTYRGVKFEYKPQSPSFPLCCELPQDARKALKLFYRGQTFDMMPPAPQPYHKPRAMNWRFTMLAEYHEQGAFA